MNTFRFGPFAAHLHALVLSKLGFPTICFRNSGHRTRVCAVSSRIGLGLFLAACVVGIGFPQSVVGQTVRLSREQLKELSEIRESLDDVNTQIRKKELDEAEAGIKQAEENLAKFAKEAGLEPDNRILTGVNRLIALRRKALTLRRNADMPKGANTGVSFEKEIAPILKEKCLQCHGEDARGGLRLDTFAGMKRGGQTGPLLLIGVPLRSLIIAKLVDPNPMRRMPRGGEALEREEIELIALWITQGAKFDGEDETAAIGASLEEKKPELPPVKVAMADGTEKVSFKKDIAPWMLETCIGCHGPNNPRSGIHLDKTGHLMRGGESGPVIVPGKPEESRLYQLVGLQDPIKMPPGQALLKRENAEDLKTWILEGAKYDGKEIKEAIRILVPTPEQILNERLAKFTPKEFAEFRMQRTKDQWQNVMKSEMPELAESDEFIVYGNVSTTRLAEVDTWAKEHLKTLRSLFGEKNIPAWKGKLTIFVSKDRFGYSEFNQVLQNRQAPGEMVGHSMVTPNYEDAYLVLQDVGDQATEEFPSLRISLVDHLTTAFLQRKETQLPNWAARGTGLAMAAQVAGANPYHAGLVDLAADAAKSITRPEDLFADRFSPTAAAAVGFTLVDFMIQAQGGQKYAQFITRLQNGGDVESTLQTVYGIGRSALAQGFAAGYKPSVK